MRTRTIHSVLLIIGAENHAEQKLLRLLLQNICKKQTWGHAKCNGNVLQFITCFQNDASNVYCHKFSITSNGY